VLERLLAGVSPGAKRALTVALIIIAWSGFIVAVIAGILEGLLVVVIGFVIVWFVTSMLSTKTAVAPEGSGATIAADGSVETPADVQERVRQRLERIAKEQQAPPADGPAPSEP
jgi:hypothetical protein